jgi:hypothetical protein
MWELKDYSVAKFKLQDYDGLIGFGSSWQTSIC